MTTEVAIMNRSAVAMAADSAVTIGTGNGVKVYDSVNKLFELIKGRPVGVMIYNAADVALRPWETVIKTYREDRKNVQFGTIDEYAADLLQYIARHDKLFSDKQQVDAFTVGLAGQLHQVRNQINYQVDSVFGRGKSASENQIRSIVKANIERLKLRVDTWDEGAWDGGLPSERTLMAKYRDHLDQVIDMVFQNLPMSQQTRSALRTAALRSFVRYSETDGAFSGIVIAGFGEDEYYPALRELRVKGLFEGVLMAKPGKTANIEWHEPAWVDSFAQGDMVRSFTVGIQDKVRGALVNFWADWQRTARAKGRAAVQSAVPSLDKADLREISECFARLGQEAVHDFFVHMQNFEGDYKQDLLQSLAHLPKDEMGAMAESLVNLTTLKRRVSINDAQTVGGAVDVAVVSRGDGFVWLKRKHYFEQALNPNWAVMHAGEAAERRASSGDEA